MENKIYQACREEAERIIREKNKDVHPVIVHVLNTDRLNQLTAELYAQKFADWIQPMEYGKDYFMQNTDGWFTSHVNTAETTHIGTTTQLHSKFVEENKGGGYE